MYCDAALAVLLQQLRCMHAQTAVLTADPDEQDFEDGGVYVSVAAPKT